MSFKSYSTSEFHKVVNSIKLVNLYTFFAEGLNIIEKRNAAL